MLYLYGYSCDIQAQTAVWVVGYTPPWTEEAVELSRFPREEQCPIKYSYEI